MSKNSNEKNISKKKIKFKIKEKKKEKKEENSNFSIVDSFMLDKSPIQKTYSLLDNCTTGTQSYTIAEILTRNINKPITKGELETQFALIWAFTGVPREKKKYSIEELINPLKYIDGAQYIPGDIQRTLRTFYTNFNKYGLEKIEKDKSHNGEIIYIWNPITMDKLENIIHPEARNIFKTQAEIDAFHKSKNFKCEMCGACKSDDKTLRLGVDHWRAHSTYNIDDLKIAVLLCEKCNNIHHNFDASKIALNNKDNMGIIVKWIKKEKEIRSYGFMPNETDLEQQRSTKREIEDYYKEINALSDDFWKGLF